MNLDNILHIVAGIFFWYCTFSVLYLFVFALAGKFAYRRRPFIKTAAAARIAVLVPAYKEDGIILPTAQNLLKLDYPADRFDIFIIADSFQPATIERLSMLPLRVLEVAFEKSTKTKALNEAFRRIDPGYDLALICDADNILARDFLKQVDSAFQQGASAVQGQRVAKNLDSSFAILDACSEGINNTIFRKGANALGLSSAVIGSGMAFRYGEVKSVLGGIDAVGGFDKPLQLEIVAQGAKIEFREQALVFDEKVESSEAFSQQRKRWVSSQFIYLKRYFIPAMKQLARGNLSYFNLAVMNNIILPRAFLLLLFPVLSVACYFFSGEFFIPFLLAWALYLLTLAISVPAALVNKDLFQALLRLPGAVLTMVLTVFQIKKANKTFIHTVHTKTEVSNPLFDSHEN